MTKTQQSLKKLRRPEYGYLKLKITNHFSNYMLGLISLFLCNSKRPFYLCKVLI